MHSSSLCALRTNVRVQEGKSMASSQQSSLEQQLASLNQQLMQLYKERTEVINRENQALRDLKVKEKEVLELSNRY